MTIIQVIILGIIQGATEFIPISSSAHLLLIPWLLQWEETPSLGFDIILHLGTVMAVLIYFWRDWLAMAQSVLRWAIKRDNSDPNLKLLGLLILGTIPAAVIGGLFNDFFEQVFEYPLVASLMLFVTAGLLFIGERIGKQDRDPESMTWLDSLLIGLAQAIAIFPGISRSGATISAGRLRGLKRETAARFSFLLATPIILGTGIIHIFDLFETGINASETGALLIGFISAFVSGYLVIRWLLNFLRSRSTAIFSIYCVLAGTVCLIVLFARGV
ncbi:MAG: undecaprenyl-diphosphatase UppP [Anaerolineae bacterium]|nr:undecaprenyl-diphosphatase UppP [Anaerolineae bacterium]